MQFCKYCGKTLPSGTAVCPHCHRAQPDAGYAAATFEPEGDDAAQYEVAEFELEEAEYELEEPEAPSADAGPEPDHVIVSPKPPVQEPPKKPEPVKYTAEPQQQSALQPKKASGLSIAAFVCSLTVILCGLGAILAIVDLAKGKNEPRKKGLSIAALVISGLVMLIAFIGNKFIKPDLLAPKEQTLNEIAAAASTNSPQKANATAKVTAKTTAKATAKATAKTTATPKPAVPSGRRITSLVTGFGFIAGLREDGTVAVSTLNYLREFSQEVAQWTDIVSIDVQRGEDFLLGLKKDGTVVVAVPDKAWPKDYIDNIRPQIDKWTDIVSIEAGWHTIFGVRSNGTVVGVCFYPKPDDDWGDVRRLKQSAEWKDIQAVTESSNDLYGLKKDGTWVCCSKYHYDDISKNGPVVSVIEDGYFLLANGTVSCIYSKPNYDFSNWTGIQKVIMSGFGVIGLKNDGTVEIVNRENESIQNVVSGWTDIVDIAAYPTHSAVFGVKSDGTVIAAGKYDDYMNTEWWK